MSGNEWERIQQASIDGANRFFDKPLAEWSDEELREEFYRLDRMLELLEPARYRIRDIKQSRLLKIPREQVEGISNAWHQMKLAHQCLSSEINKRNLKVIL